MINAFFRPICLMRQLLNSNSFVRSNSSYVNIIEDEVNFSKRIVMCNEKQRNSLGIEMIRSLQEAINTINFEKIRTLIITSSNHKVFSAGHNLKEFTTESGEALHKSVFTEFTNLCLSLKNLPVPTIAEIHGVAAAAGLQLALSCDMIIASNKASFSTPGVKFGIFCSTPGVALANNINTKLATRMLFTGEPINAQEALRSGLITEFVELTNTNKSKDDLEERVNLICKQIANQSKFIVALGKKCFYDQLDESNLESSYRLAQNAMIENLKYKDTQAGLKAFASKQKPIWSHTDKKVSDQNETD